MVEPVWIAILCLTFTLLTLLFVIQSKMMCHYSNAAINTDVKTTISDPVNVGGGPYFGLKKKKKKSSGTNWQPVTGPISTVQRS